MIVGIEGSPSCGFLLTGSSPDWQGYPGSVTFDKKYPVREGTGIFMQELKKEILKRELRVPPTLGVGLDLYGVDLNTIGPQFETELREIFNLNQ